MDLTVFKLEIDNPTFNAPFSGDKHRAPQPAPPADPDGAGTPWKRRIAGGTALLVVALGGIAVLKRRFGGGGGDDTVTIDEPDPLEETEESTANRRGVHAVIGLAFLIALTAVLRRYRDANS